MICRLRKIGDFESEHERLARQIPGAFWRCVPIVSCAGRVNLMGEHTDYNEGFVMPAAIDFSCWVAIGPRADASLQIFSENIQELAEADLANPDLRPSGGWSDYPIGVAVMLQRAGYSLRGANLYIRSDVPLGAGLSSWAANEVSVGYACTNVRA